MTAYEQDDQADDYFGDEASWGHVVSVEARRAIDGALVIIVGCHPPHLGSCDDVDVLIGPGLPLRFDREDMVAIGAAILQARDRERLS